MIKRTSIISLFISTISVALWVIFTSPLKAQSVIGAKAISMGQIGVSIPNSEWAVFNNSALLPTDGNQFSFYGFRYAGIAEITDMAASINMPSKIGVFGIGIHRYGFNLFSENRFRIAYKNSEGKIHYGTSLSYIHVFQGENYGSAGAIGLNLGVAAEITQSFWLGARATNVNQPAYGDTDEELPRELAAGLSYNPTEKAQIVSEIVKDIHFPLSFRTGIEYEFFTAFYARAGITTKPSTYSFGFGYGSNRWGINFAVQQHNPLGMSPALDLSIRI
ncbi:hypothetical protein [Rhodohalobacter barkolensis]|nr:hypothetical protein [Rhodohalobacter barkolensis]